MKNKTFSLTAAFIFLCIGIIHVLRIGYGIASTIGGWPIPMWASGVGAVIFFALAFFGFQVSRSLR